MGGIPLGSPVEWLGHPGVFIVIESKPSMARLLERGRVNATPTWTMQSELTPMTEEEAVDRLIAEAHR